MCDTHKVYVSWVSCGTQLEAPAVAAAAAAAVASPSSWLSTGGRVSPPTVAASALSGLSLAGSSSGAASSAAASGPPSYHNNLVRGVDMITFNLDRTRIKEVGGWVCALARPVALAGGAVGVKAAAVAAKQQTQVLAG